MSYENKSFKGVHTFHKVFGHLAPDAPTKIAKDTALKRASWTVEEIVEFLHATVAGVPDDFDAIMKDFLEAINRAYNKQLDEGEYTDKSDFEILVRQMDALTDISYFNYGSFVAAGVDPQPLFDIVQAANMGKLDKDTGKPIIRESDGKIMKPSYWEELYSPEPRLREALKFQMKA